MTELLPVCSHCQSERMQAHCSVDCHWSRCLECGLLSVFAKEES